MQWIIDLLIEKLRKEKEEDQDNRIPLYIEDFPKIEEKEKEEDEKSVVIIDL